MNKEEVRGIYEQLAPMLEAFYMTGGNGFAVAEALKQHALEFEEHQHAAVNAWRKRLNPNEMES